MNKIDSFTILGILLIISFYTTGLLFTDNELGNFNIDKFNNKDKKEGFSEYELEQYAQILDKAMNHMNILGSYSDFKEEYKNINKEPDFLSWKGDIALANKVDLQEYVFGKGGKHLTENLVNYSEEELHSMREEKFDITDGDKMKDFMVLLGIELGDSVEDILKFLGNIPSGLILLPRYITNRAKLTDDKIDTKDEVEAQMENDMILKENPSLMLCELLGEKGIQMLKQLGNMFVSGKNGDIAMVLVTIAGLIAGGAGAIKFGAKLGKMNKVAKVAENIQGKAAKIDDIVGGAGIGHMTGEFSSKNISNDVITKNGNLNDGARIEEAEKVLGRELNIEQKEALLDAHNYGSDKVGNYTIGEKVVKGKKLLSVGFTRSETQKLMDQGIAGIVERMINPEYINGSIINIKRSDGRVHEATVVGFDDNGKVITVWDNGSEQFSKSFSPKQLDEVNKLSNNDILQANSIEEVIDLIAVNGGIRGSQEFYSTSEIERLIYGYINGQNGANFITNTDGLRDKVVKLKEEGKILKIDKIKDTLKVKKSTETNKVKEQNIDIEEYSFSKKIDIKKELDFFSNLDNVSTDFLKLGVEYKPKHSIKIDGEEFLLTDKFTGGGNRPHIIGYVKKGNNYEPRLYYFSNSGGNWHSAPGMDGSRYSKGDNGWDLSYEKGTIIDARLNNIIDNLPEINKNFNSKDLYKLGFTTDKYQRKTYEVNDYKIKQNDKTPKAFAYNRDERINLSNVREMFNNLDVGGIDLNFTNLVKGKDMNHKYLGKIETNIITTKLDGKEIDITFANSATNNPNLVWVENIEFTNSKINSYGFSSETINAGLLTTKPIEYYSQMPKGVRLQSLNREVELVSYDDYVDIRDIIQGNPLIQAYKSIEI